MGDKPKVVEYVYGGGCGGTGSPDPRTVAILNAIPGATDSYVLQGKVTVRIENPVPTSYVAQEEQA